MAGKKDIFKAMTKKSVAVIKNRKQLSELVDKVSVKAKENKGALQGIWKDLLDLGGLVKAWAKGEYPLPKHLLLAIVVAFLYFLNPLDVIPDFLAAIGLLDDVVVIGYVLKLVRKELDRYQKIVKTTAV